MPVVKPKYLYSKKSVKHTIADIYELVTEFGATMFAVVKEKDKVGVVFKWKDHHIQICLAPHKIHAVLQTIKGIPRAQRTPEKAERMVFRLIYHFLVNNFQLVTWEAMGISEVFFAHCLMQDGKTVADHYIDSEDGRIKQLPMPVVDVEFKET